MRLTVVDRKTNFGETATNYYLTGENGEHYCWNTKSEKAWEEMTVGTTVEATFKLAGNRFNKDGVEWVTIKNVRF
jgi:hypothetical protein